MKKQKARNYVAVLFIAADDKILLSPDGDKLTLPARMSMAEPMIVVSQFCEIFDIFSSERGSRSSMLDIEEEDGVSAQYRIVWVKVKHSESRFLRQSRWRHFSELGDLDLSPVVRLAIAQAVTDGAMPDLAELTPLAEAA